MKHSFLIKQNRYVYFDKREMKILEQLNLLSKYSLIQLSCSSVNLLYLMINAQNSAYLNIDRYVNLNDV